MILMIYIDTEGVSWGAGYVVNIDLASRYCTYVTYANDVTRYCTTLLACRVCCTIGTAI